MMASTTKSPIRSSSPLRDHTRDRPGHSLEVAYRRAREQQAQMRRERLAYTVPRAALRAFPIAVVFAVLVASGLRLPVSVAVTAYLVVQLGWPLVVIGRSFDPVPEIEALREGAESERKTARIVNRLRRYGYVVMHDRRVAHSEASIGHLLVGPGGVMVMKSDASPGTVRYSKDGAKVDGQSLKKPLDLTKWLGEEVRNQTRDALPMLKVPVRPILIMVEAGVLWSDGAIDGVTLISLKDLVSYVRGRPDRLNPAEVTKVVAVAQRLFPPATANQLADHVTLDRDQWLTLMDALRTILERGGNATDMLDRLTRIENDLARLAEPGGRSGIPGARTGDNGDSGDGDSDDLINELTGSAGPAGRPALGAADDPSTGRRRGRILAAVRPLRPAASRPAGDVANDGGTSADLDVDSSADGPGRPPHGPAGPSSA
ncbi:nuclease-related domain-containing protein [Candidatus Protofrankia datiscae]|nr:nuclease-related domain-containing protein [Candidatus Protofrankia datiscae]